MHPHSFFSTFWSSKIRDEAFVIMRFPEYFTSQWKSVIEPACSDAGLTAVRVDYNIGGETVVYDILDGIAHARLVLADITSWKMTDSAGNTWPTRNGNVMWELGIAHATRIPDEVLTIRADADDLLFDVKDFRAFTYSAGLIEESRKKITHLIKQRLDLIDRRKSAYVQHVARTLDPVSVPAIFATVPKENIHASFDIRADVATRNKYSSLFEHQIFEVIRVRIEGEQILSTCQLTDFGEAVYTALLAKLKEE